MLYWLASQASIWPGSYLCDQLGFENSARSHRGGCLARTGSHRAGDACRKTMLHRIDPAPGSQRTIRQILRRLLERQMPVQHPCICLQHLPLSCLLTAISGSRQRFVVDSEQSSVQGPRRIQELCRAAIAAQNSLWRDREYAAKHSVFGDLTETDMLLLVNYRFPAPSVTHGPEHNAPTCVKAQASGIRCR